jgi:CRISPR-associated protein Csx10
MANEMMLTLRLLAPLALHQTRAGVQYVETLDYIPGTALRGALAEAYLAQHGNPDDTFHALFLSEQVFYGDLWPAASDGTTVLIPATARACKRYGLKHNESFRDALLDALSRRHDGAKCKHLVLCNGRQKECDEPLDRVNDHYLGDLKSADPISAGFRLRVSTAIERATGTVAREMLFTQHTLTGKRKAREKDGYENKAPLFFQGTLRLSNPALQDELARLLQSATSLFLGSGRSRGLGEVEVKAWTETTVANSLPDRWQKFNDAAQHGGGNPDIHYFSLTLLSHLALRDGLLCPVLGKIKPQHFGLPDGVAWVRYKDSDQSVLFLSAVTVPGWNVALGLPKPDTVALARGSVLLGQCDSGQEQAVLARLAEIETEGVGERRGEGFGRVAACYPIHYERWR